tara:strand:- start:1889 stop:2365 length:477 start_codon:yes stop_codon:yes gene_type:complete
MNRNKLQRYKPFSHAELITPFDTIINEFFNDTYSGLSKTFGDDFFVKGSYPKVNVLDLDNEVVIEAAIPGMSKEDVVVEVKSGTLTISGDSNQDSFSESHKFIRRELKKSRFQRSFALGDNLDHESIMASCNNGILTLNIAKLKPDNIQEETRYIDIV